jgi:hypothetical protein
MIHNIIFNLPQYIKIPIEYKENKFYINKTIMQKRIQTSHATVLTETLHT